MRAPSAGGAGGKSAIGPMSDIMKSIGGIGVRVADGCDTTASACVDWPRRREGQSPPSVSGGDGTT